MAFFTVSNSFELATHIGLIYVSLETHWYGIQSDADEHSGV